MSHSNSTTNLR